MESSVSLSQHRKASCNVGTCFRDTDCASQRRSEHNMSDLLHKGHRIGAIHNACTSKREGAGQDLIKRGSKPQLIELPPIISAFSVASHRDKALFEQLILHRIERIAQLTERKRRYNHQCTWLRAARHRPVTGHGKHLLRLFQKRRGSCKRGTGSEEHRCHLRATLEGGACTGSDVLTGV
mgnify:CR=1 FL=1